MVLVLLGPHELVIDIDHGCLGVVRRTTRGLLEPMAVELSQETAALRVLEVPGQDLHLRLPLSRIVTVP